MLKDHEHDFLHVYEADNLSTKEAVLMAAMNMLNEKERSAILLFELGGFSITEIMKIQGESSLSAIKSRLSRTREKLRNTIVLLEQANEKGGRYDFKNSLPGY